MHYKLKFLNKICRIIHVERRYNEKREAETEMRQSSDEKSRTETRADAEQRSRDEEQTKTGRVTFDERRNAQAETHCESAQQQLIARGDCRHLAPLTPLTEAADA